MTTLVLYLMVLLAPAAATSSWGQDVAYYRAAQTWQHVSPATYYAHTAIVILLAAIVYRRHSQRTLCALRT